MAQLVTDDFPLAASVWSGDKFLMEAATTSGSKRMKVTAEVVGAYLSGSGSGTIIVPDSIPIEDIDAITDTKEELAAKAQNHIAVQVQSDANGDVKVETSNTTPKSTTPSVSNQNEASEINKSDDIADLSLKSATIDDLTKRAVKITEFKRSAKVTEFKRSAKINEITRRTTIIDGTPRARVIYVG